MSLEDLGNVGEFVAAVAVIISLIYLAVQIRQNTRSVRSSTNQGIRKMIQEIDLLLASDPELNRIWTLGRKDPACLDQEQWGRFSTLVLMFYRNFENAYYERQNKAVDERVYRPWAAYSLRLSSQPGVVRWWESYHELMSEEFQHYVERGRVAEECTGADPHISG